jgi:exodeoxyribonuclease VII large subunit
VTVPTENQEAAVSTGPTWSVTELHQAIASLLDHVFGEDLWIEGEMRNLSRSRRGHAYFDLVDAGEQELPQRPTLAVTLFDRERQAVNRFLKEQGDPVRMVDGLRVRVRGRLTTYPARSTLQLRMTGIDPAFTLGLLGQERERLLAALSADGLLDRNSGLVMTGLPLRVAVVTSIGSAAHADALDELRRSGFGFHVTVVDARTQGLDAERSLVAALRAAESTGVDVVALVRGGGARSDLAAFDSEAVCRAIADLSVPVITGIGHETDRTVADEVAHTAHKTPTACAAALVVSVAAASVGLHDAWIRLGTAAEGRIMRAERQLDRTGRATGVAATRHLDRAGDRISNLAARAATAAPRPPAAAGVTLDALASRLAHAARSGTRRSAEQLESLAARASGHDPARALARGWSVTRLADGTLVRSVEQLSVGEPTTTTVADGSFGSSTETVVPGTNTTGG